MFPHPRAKKVFAPAHTKPKPGQENSANDNGLLNTIIRRYAAPEKRPEFMSLWTMLELQSESLLAAMTYLAGAASEARVLGDTRTHGPYETIQQKALKIHYVEVIQAFAKKYEMKTTISLAGRAHGALANVLAVDRPHTASDLSTIKGQLETLLQCFISEASAMKFFAMPVGADGYHKPADDLIGAHVVDAFPGVQFDLTEAGRCLSFEIWTAAVMHCMRALEVGLNVLATEVSVAPTENWNRTLNDIEKGLRQINRKEDGSEAEQWAAEAGTHLRFVKNAWRNHAMHSSTSYDKRRAEDIFRNTLSFLEHLATKISQ